jgi:anti-anti-sigma factor
MSFTSTIEIVNGIARITLVGELDASVASQFRAQVEEAAKAQAKRLVLIMNDLDYMASAGLRALAYAKQKMGPNVDIYMIGVQEPVLDTLTQTGFRDSVILLDTYDAAQIETL